MNQRHYLDQKGSDPMDHAFRGPTDIERKTKNNLKNKKQT